MNRPDIEALFETRQYRPEITDEGLVIDLQAEALENDPDYRALIFKQLYEESALASFHAEERIRFIAARRRRRHVRLS